MNERVSRLAAELRALVNELGGCVVRSSDAIEMVEQFATIEKLGVAGRTLAAARVVQTRAWFGSGTRSATEWLAARTGSTLGAAAESIKTASMISDLPETRDALLAGKLSEVQANEIAAASAEDPSAEAGLVELATRESVAALKEKCRDVRAAAIGDEDATERIRRSRYFKHWTERDGAVRLDARLAADDAAPFLAAVHQRTSALVDGARRAGMPESFLACAADALVSLADGAGAPKAVVHVHVSQSARSRGHTVSGETARIAGVGPISVGAAERLAQDADVRVIEGDGIDVTRVSHAGRTIPASIQRALEARDTTCVVPGCNSRLGLEIDHIVPFGQGGATTLRNLARLCRWHHAQKTHHGFRLEGTPGSWRFARGGRPRSAEMGRAP